jgi:hypothetical protein
MNNLRVAAPCNMSWDEMAGDERVRHCSLCSLHVYNFAEMTGDEVRELLARTEGRVCVRLYHRADGTVLTRDCPTGLRALRQRVSRAAAAVIAALLSFPAFARGDRACEKPRIRRGSHVKLEIERVATSQQAAFTGIVADQSGSPIPGVTVVLRNESTKAERSTVTDENGAFTIDAPSDGLYRADVTLAGFKPAVVEHLRLKASQVTRARVALRADIQETIVVGALAVDPLTSEISTTFSQEFINKLPL